MKPNRKVGSIVLALIGFCWMTGQGFAASSYYESFDNPKAYDYDKSIIEITKDGRAQILNQPLIPIRTDSGSAFNQGQRESTVVTSDGKVVLDPKTGSSKPNIAVVVTPPPPSGASAIWKFDDFSGSSTVVDSIGSWGLNGTYRNTRNAVTSVTRTEGAKRGGYAAYFDGATRVAVGQSHLSPNTISYRGRGASESTNQWTISALVRPAADPTAMTIYADYADYPNRGNSQQIHLRVYKNQFQLVCYSVGNNLILTHPTTVQNGRWYHVAATLSGDTTGTMARLYVDGNSVGLAKRLGIFYTDAWYNPYIGAAVSGWGPVNTSYFKGAIDELAIWQRALSAGEIMNLSANAREKEIIRSPPPREGTYLSDPIDGPSENTKWTAFNAKRDEPLEDPLNKPADYYWPFDGDTKDMVSGLTGNGGSFKDDFPVTAYQNSKSLLVVPQSSALAISGSALNPDGDFQLSFWLRTRLLEGVILQKGPRGDGYEVSLTSAGAIAFKRNLAVGMQGTTRVNDGEWRHVVCGANGIYIDGAPEAVTSVNPSFVPKGSVGTLYVGSVPNPDVPLTSPVSVDDLAIYSHTLSPAEIGFLAAGVKRPYVLRGGYTYEKKLLGLWHLDGDWSDSAGAANGSPKPAVASSSPAFVAGVSGAAANFSSSGVPGATIDVGSPSTLTLWVKTKSAGTPVLSAGAEVLLSINATGMLTYGNLSCPLDVTDGNWHHVALLDNGLLYVDGQRVGSKTSGGSPSGQILVGSGFTGEIDEIAAFNGVLYDQDILDLYKRGALQIRYQFSTSPSGQFTSWSGGGVPDKGAAGVWRFNEKAVDSTDNLVAGKVGNAIKIDGGPVKFPSQKSLASSLKGLTVSAWVKGGAGAPSGGILAGADGAFALGLDAKGKLTFSAGAATTSASAAIADADWHQVAGVFSGGSRLEVYVDGVLTGTLPSGVPVVIQVGTSLLDLGKGGSKLIDELVLYGRALAPAEIWNLYETASYATSDDVFLMGLNRDKESHLRYSALLTSLDPSLSPALSSVSVSATGHNRAGTYAITGKTSHPFTYLSGFEQTLGRPLNAGEMVTYSLSPNGGQDWYFVDSSGTWAKVPDSVGSKDPVESYSSAGGTVRGAIAAFDNVTYAAAKDKGYGDLRVRSYLTSDGSSSPSLDTLTINYDIASVKIVEPLGPLFIGLSQKIPCLLTSSTGVKLDDLKLEFLGVAVDGAAAGLVSEDPLSLSAGVQKEFVWDPIPTTKMNSVKIKISSPSAAAVSYETSTSMDISAAKIKVTSPTSASAREEKLGVGSTTQVQWRIDGPITAGAMVKAFWASANGENPDRATWDWKPIFSGTAVSTGVEALSTGSSYGWYVPQEAAGKVVIKVEPVGWDAAPGFSEVIAVPISITLLSPSNGLKWAAGAEHFIEWTTTPDGVDLPLAIQYSKDDRRSWIDIATSSAKNRKYGWKPDPKKDAGSLWIRVSEVGGLAAAEAGPFTVSSIIVDTPSAEKTRWEANSTQTITWRSTGVSQVNIFYSADGSFTDTVTLATNLTSGEGGNSTGFDWKKLEEIHTTLAAKIRVQDADQPAGSDFATDDSDNPFAIYGKIKLVNPAALAVPTWDLGKMNAIKWEVSQTPNAPKVVMSAFKIEIKDANRPTAEIIPAEKSIVKGTSYDWTPDFTSPKITVSVFDANDASVGDSADLRVGGSGIRLVDGVTQSPLKDLTVGQSAAIILDRDQVTATNMKVKVDLMVGETVEKNIVLGQLIGNGPSVSFPWSPVLDVVTDNAKIRIRQILATGDQGTPLEVYSTIFTIKPFVSIDNLTTAKMKSGDKMNISVKTKGSVSSLEIYVSRSGFDKTTGKPVDPTDGQSAGLKNVILSGTTLKTTVFSNWEVPSMVGSAAQIKVVAKKGAMESFAVSNPFKVSGTINLLPFSNTYVGELGKSIEWKTSTNIGSDEKIKIELLRAADAYSEDKTVLLAEAYNNRAYAWSVMLPESLVPPPQMGAKLKISLVSDPTVRDVSDVFLIKWAKVTFKVTDVENSGLLSGLNVSDTTLNNPEADPPRPWPNWAEDGGRLSSGASHYYPYGKFNAIWSRNNADYFDKSVEFTVDAPNKEVPVKMENRTSTPMTAEMEYSYDAKKKKLSANVWVEKNGVMLKDRSRLGPASLTIYEDDKVDEIMILDGRLNSKAVYEMSWFLDKKDPELKPGVLYFTEQRVLVDGVREVVSGGSIQIGQAEEIMTIVSQINTIAQSASEASGQAAAAASSTLEIQKQNEGFGKSIMDIRKVVGSSAEPGDTNTVFGKVAEVLKSTGEVSEGGAAKKTMQQQLSELRQKTAKAPKMLQRMTQAAPGEQVKVQFQSDSGLIPRADIYTPDNKLMVSGARLAEIGNSGIYEFKWYPGANIPQGDYTVVVQEPANGNVDSMSVKIKKAEGTVALPESAATLAEPSVLKPSEGASSEADAAKKPETAESTELMVVKKSLDALMAKIEEMQKTGTLSPEDAEKKKEELAAVAPRTFATGPAIEKDLAASQAQVKSLAESQGIDLGNLMELTQEQTAEIKSQSEEIRALRNYIERINAVLDALNSTVGADKPIVKDWMETA